jgi:hypothetical protein
LLQRRKWRRVQILIALVPAAGMLWGLRAKAAARRHQQRRWQRLRARRRWVSAVPATCPQVRKHASRRVLPASAAAAGA